ncbi:MAG: formimidoylglutamase [Bacteroidota bacterium]|nr:formimidoylglutamase [Bacteroidota bacterium]
MEMNLNDYISLPDFEASEYKAIHKNSDLFYRIAARKNDLSAERISEQRVVILSVPEDRNSDNKGSANSPDAVRRQLYNLYLPSHDIPILDLGNLKQGKTVKDTYRALYEVYLYLLSLQVIPVIIGGSQDLMYSVFKVYDALKQPFNLTNIDARFDLGPVDDAFQNHSFLSKLIQENSPYLFNYTHIGYQTYYNSPDDISLLDELWFECIRLGKAKNEINENEPFLRDSDFACIDINAVRQSDAPGRANASVHGFSGEEACQLSKYAGMSDRLSGFGIFEMNPEFDRDHQTAEFTAQLVWHFIQGVWLRKGDFPKRPVTEYRKFIIQTEEEESTLIFYKNPKTGRWWMEVPFFEKKEEKNILVSCSPNDYKVATEGDIPERWWRFYQKLSRAAAK